MAWRFMGTTCSTPVANYDLAKLHKIFYLFVLEEHLFTFLLDYVLLALFLYSNVVTQSASAVYHLHNIIVQFLPYAF